MITHSSFRLALLITALTASLAHADTYSVTKLYSYERQFSAADELTDVGGTLFFTAEDGPEGRELWKSDGTVAGTGLVKDVSSGSYHSR